MQPTKTPIPENLLLKALIGSYWYHSALLANATSELDRINFRSILARTVTRIADIEGQRVQ